MSLFSVTCTKENLMTGLTRVAPIAGRNTQLPILQHILLEGKNSSLHLTTTDLELGVHTIIGGKIEGNGSVTVPARSFLGYIQQLPTNNPITLQGKEGVLHVVTSGFTAQFPVANPDDFPLLPKGSTKGGITLSGEKLSRALAQVIFAAAREEIRPEIRGVYVDIADGVLRLAATDSFRLAEEIVAHTSGGKASFILPLSSAHEVIRLFADQGEVTIAPQDSHILIFSDEVDMSSRLVDGSYPDYQQIIPRSSTTTIQLSAPELLQALKTLTVFLPRDSRRVELTVNPSKGILVAQVVGSGAGEGVIEVPVEGTGESLTVIVNIQYLLEGLQHLPTNMCVIGLGNESSPIIIQPDKAAAAQANKKNQYVYVVMPIRS